MPDFNVTVDATTLWMDTGLTLDGTATVRIAANGEWSANPANGLVGPDGHAGLIAKEGYNLEGQVEGLLVGQVVVAGGSPVVFPVGPIGFVPDGLIGPLHLSINDDMNGIYGAGFTDNEGSLTVRITVAA